MPKIYNRIDLDRIVNIKEPEISYVLGLISTDGCIKLQKPKKSKWLTSEILQLDLSELDRQILEDYAKILGIDDRPIYIQNKKQASGVISKQVRLSVCQSGIKEAFSKWGITPNKTFDLKYPKNIPFESHFMRGVFDGDGSIFTTKQNKHIASFCGSSKNFMKGVEKLLINIGTNPHLKSYTEGYNEPHYDIRIHGKVSIENLYNYLYKDCTICLERKKKRFDKILGT